ncbi:MAG TPA: sugar phosphate nucleotidyltransferase [Candidatus Polarisedimenticolia bacterium]|nr:sugar phosphate nucleotidyltransferase [Candidatus Polarisedimenticolia bacterium]
MRDRGKSWAIVLAAGEGTRLRALTTDRTGVSTPKQYCSLRGDGSLLDRTLRRGRRVVPRSNMVTVVAAQHRQWWESALADLPEKNLIVQPRNRGTAAGLLLPLLSILSRDPEARVLVLPSDHFVEDEATLERALRRALSELERDRDGVILLGITPDAAVPDYGWIVPQESAGRPTLAVSSFVEKPDPDTAADLLEQGGAWNSFIFAARGRSLLRLYQRRLPGLLRAFHAALGEKPGELTPALIGLYEAIETTDFSRDILQGSEPSLRLLPVPPCGWTDLGTPARVSECLTRLRGSARGRAVTLPGFTGSLNLSLAAQAGAL